MITNLPEWLNHATKSVTPDLVERRRKGVEDVIAEADGKITVEDLAKILVGQIDEESEGVQTFRSLFQTADPTFLMRKNDQEMRVLSGTVIAAYIEDEDNHSDWLDHLAMLVCSSHHLRKPAEPWNEFYMMAEGYVAARAQKLRVTPSKGTLPDPKSATMKITEITTHTQGNQLPQASPHLVEALKSVQADIKTMFARHNRLSEESNILWWLMGEQAVARGELLGKVDWTEAAFPAALELVTITPFPIATPNAPNFLLKFLSSAKGKQPAKLSILELADKTDAEWLGKAFLKEAVADELEGNFELYPVCNVLLQRHQLKSSAKWHESVKASKAIKADAQVETAKLLRQVIMELNALTLGDHLNG